MDLITIWSLYKGCKKGVKIAKWLNGLYYGDDTTLNTAKSYYDAADLPENSDKQVQYLLTAKTCFEQSIGQKKYIDATAYFYLAMCHLRIGEFNKSYEYIEKLQSISIDTSTVRKDYIEDIKQHAKELREVVKEIEQKVNKKQSNNSKSKKSQEKNIIGSLKILCNIIVVVIVIIGLFGVLEELSGGYISRKSSFSSYDKFKSDSGLHCSGSKFLYVDTSYVDYRGLSRAIENLGGCTVADFDERGNWVVFYNHKPVYSDGLTDYLRDGIKKAKVNGWDVIDFSLCNGKFAHLYGVGGGWSNHPELYVKINEGLQNHERFRFASFNSLGEWILSTNEYFRYSDDWIREFCYKAKQFYGNINYVYLSDKGRIAICEKGIYYENLPSNLVFELMHLDFIPTKIKFSDNGFYIITNDDGKYKYNLYNKKTIAKEIKRYYIRLVDFFV